jgi:protein-disulfide isomerase
MKKNSSLSWLIGIVLIILIVWAVTKIKSPSSNNSSSSSNSQSTPANTTISDSPYLGDKSVAKVAIIEFSDYECPYCQQFFLQTFDQVVSTFVNTNKAIFVYREFAGVGGNAAETESNAALCVKDQKGNSAYFQMAKLIYQNTGLEGKGITNDNLIKFAVSIGADQTKFTSCLNADTFKNSIQKDTSDAEAAGVTGTPSFLIGKIDSSGKVVGDLLVGGQTISTLQSEVDKFSK